MYRIQFILIDYYLYFLLLLLIHLYLLKLIISYN